MRSEWEIAHESPRIWSDEVTRQVTIVFDERTGLLSARANGKRALRPKLAVAIGYTILVFCAGIFATLDALPPLRTLVATPLPSSCTTPREVAEPEACEGGPVVPVSMPIAPEVEPKPPAKVAPPEMPTLYWPIASTEITSRFGRRKNPLTSSSQHHGGVDIRCPIGTPVLAVADGEVISANRRGRAGLTVRISHAQGIRTIYSHLKSAEVHQGDQVRGGQRIGRSGASGQVTGPHLHLAIHKDRRFYNPLMLIWKAPPAMPPDAVAKAESLKPAGGAAPRKVPQAHQSP